MRSSLWLLTTLIFAITGRYSAYDNETAWHKGLDGGNGEEELLGEDVYMAHVGRWCRAGSLSACLEKGAGSFMLDVLSSARSQDEHEATTVTLVKTTIPSLNSSSSFTKRAQSNLNQTAGFLGFLMRTTDTYLRTTGLVVDLNDDLTEGGLYRPRFIDEIYSEIDTLEDKNAKPNRRHEFKKLFIPLLVILKLFKLKLLVFLPVLLGLASFKKIIALFAVIIPAIVGYLKVCKPDLGNTYGSYGHSSFYNGPPSIKRKQYQHAAEEYSLPSSQHLHHATQMAYQPYSTYQP